MNETFYEIDARKLIAQPVDTVWEKLCDVKARLIVKFDDGDVHSSVNQTLWCLRSWEFLRRYPKTPVLKRFHGAELFKGDLPIKAVDRLNESLIHAVIEAYETDVSDIRLLVEELARLHYEVVNEMYNDMVRDDRAAPHAPSLDILDFVQFYNALRDDYEKIEPSDASITSLVEKLMSLTTAPEFSQNALARSMRYGVARQGQFSQILGARGFVTEINSDIFPNPILRNYLRGISNLADHMMVTRSASKSLANATKPLQDAEYFSRRQQLIAIGLKNLHMGDCGSKHYMRWTVRGSRNKADVFTSLYDGGDFVDEEIIAALKTPDKGDLPLIVGKFYLDPDTNTLKEVKATDTHLIGKTLLLRSPIAGCQHQDLYGICSTCYGSGAKFVPKRTNLGHMCCVALTAIIGQLILSTKHYDGNAKVEPIILSSEMRPFLATVKDSPNIYFLNSRLKGKRVRIYIDAKHANGLADIDVVKDIKELAVSRISQIKQAWIQVGDSDNIASHQLLNLALSDNRKASMSTAFLKHCKAHGYSLDQQGRYVFTMTEWNFDDPIFVLPLAHYNMSNHQSEIAKMLEATAADVQRRSEYVDPEVMMTEFYDLVNSRITVHLSILECVLYATMIVSAVEGNYAFPKPWHKKAGVGVMRQIMAMRSMGPLMAYQNHHDSLSSASSFGGNRPDHPFDVLIKPDILNPGGTFWQQPGVNSFK